MWGGATGRRKAERTDKINNLVNFLIDHMSIALPEHTDKHNALNNAPLKA